MEDVGLSKPKKVEPKPNDADYTILGNNAEGRVLTALEMGKRFAEVVQKGEGNSERRFQER